METLGELEACIDPAQVGRQRLVRETVSDIRRFFAQGTHPVVIVRTGGKSLLVERDFKLGELAKRLYALLDS